MSARLGPIADRIAGKLGDIRSEPEWEAALWDVIGMANYGDLDTKQADIVFGMVVRRWSKPKETPQ